MNLSAESVLVTDHVGLKNKHFSLSQTNLRIEKTVNVIKDFRTCGEVFLSGWNETIDY